MSNLRQPLVKASVERMSYILRHLPGYLADLQEVNRLYSLLTDIFFLEAKAQGVSVFDLAADFTRAVAVIPPDYPNHKILRLLEEAIRMNIHFINRHTEDYPQALFQCLWNSCWWYDCPEAVKYYELPGGHQRHRRTPPRKQREPKLYRLLETWRDTKEKQELGFCWLRSLRPPEMPLGNSQRMVLCGHESGVASVAVSPDGKRIASGSRDGVLRLWSADTGQEVGSIHSHTQCLQHVTFSQDSRCVASIGQDRVNGEPILRTWRVETQKQLVAVRCGDYRGGRSYDIVFLKDGRLIASGIAVYGDRLLRVWEVESGRELACLQHEDSVSCVVYSEDGRRIATGSDKTVRLWDLQSNEQQHCLRGHQALVWCIAYSSDYRRIVSGAIDGTIRTWDVESGESLLCLHAYESWVHSVAFSPDGSRIVSGGGDTVGRESVIRIWDSESGKELACLQGHRHSVQSVIYSPDSKRIVSGSQDGTVRIWDVERSGEQRRLHEQNTWIESIAYLQNGQRIVSTGGTDSEAGEIVLWDAENGKTFCHFHDSENHCINVFSSPSGRHFISWPHGKIVKVRNAENGKVMLCLGGHECSIDGVRYLHNGQRIITWSKDSIRVWNVEDGRQVLCIRDADCRHAWHSPNSRQIVVGTWDGALEVWNTKNGKRLYGCPRQERSVVGVAFSPDGKRFVSAAFGQSIRKWDVESGKQLLYIPRPSNGFGPNSVAYSPDTRTIACGGLYEDPTVRVYDAKSGAALLCLRGHKAAVSEVTYSPDGSRIISFSEDEVVREWDTKTGECLDVLKGQGDIYPVVAGASVFPYRASALELETVIKDARTGLPIAWFPVSLSHITTHPTGLNWAAAVDIGYHLYVFTLEGTELCNFPSKQRRRS